MPEQLHAVRNGIICACVTAASVLVSWPVAEMGFVDDWSYVKTAFVFARTGHIVYNGWATAMLGWAIPWAALFIKMFGFSFTAVRLSTLPLAMASVYLLHASLVRFGITARNALVGALTLGVSPLFLPLAASYMTDVAGLFCILLCLYLCQRALAANSDRTTILWLACAALTNVAGGTVRQIAWLGTLVMVPSTAWLLRKRSGVVRAASLLWIGSVLCVLACIRWFERQPYSLSEKIILGPIIGAIVGHRLAELLKALLCLALITFPILAAWIPVQRSLSRGALIRIASILAALGAVSIVLGNIGSLDHRVLPWLGHVIGTLSIFSSTGEMLGSRPVTFYLLGLVMVLRGVSLNKTGRHIAVGLSTALVLTQIAAIAVYFEEQGEPPARFDRIVAMIPSGTRIAVTPKMWLAFVQSGRPVTLLYLGYDGRKLWSMTSRNPLQGST